MVQLKWSINNLFVYIFYSNKNLLLYCLLYIHNGIIFILSYTTFKFYTIYIIYTK